jgi:DNA-binding transcriptional ArsR family regulator
MIDPDPLIVSKARVLKAMAHPSRLLIIEALAKGEKCVCELQALVGSDLSTVSKHLSLMEAAGLLANRKEGLYVYYRLRVPCILRFFDCVEAVLADQAKYSTVRPNDSLRCATSTTLHRSPTRQGRVCKNRGK